jgi:hypothetical protein
LGLITGVPLRWLPGADPLTERGGGGSRVDVQLRTERLGAHAILAQREVRLALAVVAAHQAAVGILAARVPLDDAEA